MQDGLANLHKVWRSSLSESETFRVKIIKEYQARYGKLRNILMGKKKEELCQDIDQQGADDQADEREA